MSACRQQLDEISVVELIRAAFRKLPAAIAGRHRKRSAAAGLAAGASLALWFLPPALPADARLTMIATVLCIIGWTLTRIPDSLVAIAGAVGLVAAGVLPTKTLYAALGSEIVWLLIAAFLIAAVLKASGLVERCVAIALRPFTTIRGVFYAIASLIAMTAFLVPSTSGRAALLLPVYLALAGRLPDQRLVRPLALLFPTAILLSAGGSLIGAGAHFIAVDAIARKTGGTIGFLQWIALAFPVAMLSTLAATWLILRLFVPRDALRDRLAATAAATAPLDRRQKSIIILLAGMIGAWLTTSWHGFDVAFVAVGGAALLMSGVFTDLKPKELFRGVETELIVFLAATAVIADAATATGLDRWLAGGVMAVVPASLTGSLPVVVTITALVALLAHIAINSRTARAAVLIPAVALPMAALGHDAEVLVLVTVLGTGFCQTMMASAKPVAIYGNLETSTFNQNDLFRLAMPLLPLKFALLMIFALSVWPHQLTGGGDLGTTATHADAGDRAPAAEMPAARVGPLHSAPFPGASCPRAELKTLMTGTIAERGMWASGWWHVWNRLRKDGYRVDRAAIKTIYRDDDMVRLRKGSETVAALRKDRARLIAAAVACRAGGAPN